MALITTKFTKYPVDIYAVIVLFNSIFVFLDNHVQLYICHEVCMPSLLNQNIILIIIVRIFIMYLILPIILN